MILEVLKREMDNLNINYSFMRYVCDVPQYPYFVGDYTENDFSPEDQLTSGEINIEGWSRNNVSELIAVKEILKRHFDEYSTVENGYAVMINYDNGMVIDSGEADLYKVSIKLSFKEWKGVE